MLFRYANIKLCIFQPCEGHDTKVIAIICTTVSFDTQANARIHVEREIESYVRLVPIAWYDYIVFVLCIHLHAILVSVFFLFFLFISHNDTCSNIPLLLLSFCNVLTFVAYYQYYIAGCAPLSLEELYPRWKKGTSGYSSSKPQPNHHSNLFPTVHDRPVMCCVLFPSYYLWF